MMGKDTNVNEECEPISNALSEQVNTRAEGNGCVVKDDSSYLDDHFNTSSLCSNAAIINKVRIIVANKMQFMFDLSVCDISCFVLLNSPIVSLHQTFHLLSRVTRPEIPNPCYNLTLSSTM